MYHQHIVPEDPPTVLFWTLRPLPKRSLAWWRRLKRLHLPQLHSWQD